VMVLEFLYFLESCSGFLRGATLPMRPGAGALADWPGAQVPVAGISFPSEERRNPLTRLAVRLAGGEAPHGSTEIGK
ncbi:hypothetical protein V2S84_17215, partial [Azotobacter chroococcum]|nr:hypothetical protein [Azotobacter chroococcum]